MDSSSFELTHAAPDHGSPSPGGGGAATADEGGAGVRKAATTTDSGLSGCYSGGYSGECSGDYGSEYPSLLRDATAAAVTTAAPGSGVMRPALVAPATVPAAPAPAPATAAAAAAAAAQTPTPAPPPARSAPTVPSQASQASHASHASHISHSAAPSLSSRTPLDFNFNGSPSAPNSPPSQHGFLHAHRQNHNSSKLPAFRFTDLNKETIAQPLLLQPQHQHHHHQHHQHQHHHIPPSPVSPNSDQHPETQPNSVNQFSPPRVPRPETTQNHKLKRKIVSAASSFEHLDQVRSRASTFQPTPATTAAAAAATSSSAHVKRSVSLHTTNAVSNTTGVGSPSVSTETAVTVHPRRAPTTPNTPSEQDTDPAGGGLPAEAATREKEILSGQRELLLLKTLQRTVSDEKRASILKKPPVSYRPRTNTSGSGVSASIPPIRSFRSSGERRSVVLDMNVRSARNHDGADEFGDANHRDRTLRALEGRRPDEVMQWTPPDSAGERPDADDSGDLFLKIAREDSSQRTPDNGRVYADRPNVISRVARSTRRPLSVAISSYRSPSPPRISRRMSEQESRIRAPGQDQVEKAGPPVSFRGHSREPHSEDLKFKANSTPLRASPLSPRTFTFHGITEPTSAHRLRQPSIDRGSAPVSRMSSMKQPNVNYSHPRAYNSSPLVSFTSDTHTNDAQPNESAAAEGTDSTTSNGPPSTVWDELEELKSRIHRLELTGKLPPTSSAAISRASDERPPTAHTNATTLSASPKRGASIVQSVEAPMLPKDSHPLLHSALAKSKDFLLPEVYDALEAATVDALGLAALMGTAGQPGPISSGGSNIGSNSGTVTDRQLRKKADSVCRSLTELCLALSENANVNKPQPVVSPSSEEGSMTSPTITQFTGMVMQRRPSIPANRAAELAASPRAFSRYEEKRNAVLASSALPHPRHSATTPTTTENTTPGRKSSLLFSRTQRAGTEEPEEGRRTSNLLRSRRAGTEEPEDLSDRKPILTRGRRATVNNNEEDSRLRTPSRAITEVNGARPREYISHLPPPPITKEVDTLANSALPRRRLGSTTTINTRLAQPAVVTTQTMSGSVTPNRPIATPSRRYFDRPIVSRETVPEADRVSEDRPQRQFSLARSGSLNRRLTHRQSMIATPSTTTTSYYR
ncbi:hypothetical protein SAMD00023353_1701460 [Rosellinia necatrix]|uniref:Lpxtg-motif cell wall anchor domain-containing protein n=1 Tax=Rosellinia necatrix TaxID=77044 RepID=A0A1W2TJW2_ROSNE|nr:hypothetical protein SAMD00023353_1701460 [Rosellinia necatrix]